MCWQNFVILLSIVKLLSFDTDSFASVISGMNNTENKNIAKSTQSTVLNKGLKQITQIVYLRRS